MPRFRTKFNSLFTLSTLTFIAILLCGCSSSNNSTNATTTLPPIRLNPVQVMPVPLDTISLSPPLFNGGVWVLSGNSSSKSITEYGLADGKKLNIVPVNKNAVAISSDGIAEVIIGIAGPNNTGAIEFYNGLTGAFEGTLPLPDPVKMISSTTSAGSLLVLLTTNLVRSVAVINMATKDISKIIPVSDGTLSISNGRDPSTFFALQNNQTVQSISLNSGQIESYINLQQPGINLALSNDENVLLVLKCSVNFCNIALVNTSTDEIYNTLPAPLDCIGLELSSDGNTIYDLVDTHSSSNIQSYNVATYIQ